MVDPLLSVIYINTAAEALLDVSGRRVIGEPLGSLFRELEKDGEGHSEGILVSAAKRLAFTKREAQLVLPNRQTVTVDCAVTPVFIGEDVDYLVMELESMDRLLRISREESLIASQQTSRTLIRGMAHEIKNPLGGLRGAAQLLEKQLPSEELKDYTNVIIEEADRLSKLVDRMLGSNSLPNMKAVNIHEILERVKSLIDAETGGEISIKRDYDPSMPELLGDKEQLIQAVLNIVRNAMQVLTNQGDNPQPCITLKTRPLRQMTLGTLRHRLVCKLEISDNGPGIPAAIRETLFLPMVSGRADGTGLGLSISQSIINHHKGIIECESEPGNTTFALYIPLEQQA